MSATYRIDSVVVVVIEPLGDPSIVPALVGWCADTGIDIVVRRDRPRLDGSGVSELRATIAPEDVGRVREWLEEHGARDSEGGR